MYKTLWRETVLLWLFSLRKLPMVFWLRPRIVRMNETEAVIMMRFGRRTKNHVNSMYFGVLCVGAELAGGTLTMNLFHQQKEKFVLIFKDFHAEFLKRCEGDVYFTCHDGAVISELIAKAKQSNARESGGLNVTATIPSLFGDEPVGKFTLTLSIKKKG